MCFANLNVLPHDLRNLVKMQIPFSRATSAETALCTVRLEASTLLKSRDWPL